MIGTHRAARLCTIFLLIVAASAGRVAHGYNIGFDNLVGLNNTAFVLHSEGGFSVAPVAGDWRNGQVFGDPTPSIFGVPPTLATVRVTDITAGQFRFDRVGMIGNNSSTTTYSIQGFFNNVSVLPAINGTLNLADTFFNIPNPSPSTILDRLDITLSGNSSTSFNVDNIVVHHIPEPSAVALLALGCVGLAARRLRRISR